MKLDCHVALDSAFDANPAHYDDRRYIAATWTTNGRDVSALIHEEYHADQHKTCRVGDSLGCWFNTVLAFHSADGGASFAPSTPLVVASAPFRQDVEQGRHRGFFNPSNMFSDGRWTYAFISTTGWEGQAPGNCLFRTREPGRRRRLARVGRRELCRALREPVSLARQAQAVRQHRAVPVPRRRGGARPRHKLWIAVFQAAATGATPLEGFYYATARDLFHWSEPRLLMAGRTAYSNLCAVGPSIINYPSLMDPTSTSRNFDTIGERTRCCSSTSSPSRAARPASACSPRPLKLDWDRRQAVTRRLLLPLAGKGGPTRGRGRFVNRPGFILSQLSPERA